MSLGAHTPNRCIDVQKLLYENLKRSGKIANGTDPRFEVRDFCGRCASRPCYGLGRASFRLSKPAKLFTDVFFSYAVAGGSSV